MRRLKSSASAPTIAAIPDKRIACTKSTSVCSSASRPKAASHPTKKKVVVPSRLRPLTKLIVPNRRPTSAAAGSAKLRIATPTAPSMGSFMIARTSSAVTYQVPELMPCCS